MTEAMRALKDTSTPSRLKLHVPAKTLGTSASWLISGYPAKIWIWTAEEWARLTDRPSDARQCPNGIWCALRME